MRARSENDVLAKGIDLAKIDLLHLGTRLVAVLQLFLRELDNATIVAIAAAGLLASRQAEQKETKRQGQYT